MKKIIMIRVIAFFLLTAVTVGTFVPVVIKNKNIAKSVEETTKVTTTKEQTTIEETTTEAGDAEPAGGSGGGSSTETAATYTVQKYTGGALPYLDWETAKALDPNYFANSVFIGDSVSLKLQMYGGLPGATYLCYGNFGSTNALRGVVKANVWDSVGNKRRVYIMLGMNDLNAVGVSGAVSNMQQLCSKIQAANPNSLIYVQSMTPITKAKNGTNGRTLNNDNIRYYNQCLSNMAASNGWYFVDVASVMYTDEGNLKDEYCGDPGSMGLHFSAAGCGAWCWYLMYHCYDPAWNVYTLTVNCIDRDTKTVLKTVTGDKYAAGATGTIFAPEVLDYTPEQPALNYTFAHADLTIDAYYKKNPPPTTENSTTTTTTTEASTTAATTAASNTDPTESTSATEPQTLPGN